ncbi:hypothetical protein GLOTRDRAFT_73909 [Gloeophyllum trabeum ATCC 11539]|uniref:AB hydrolase-1 domain-containing protein n=1 Tax=Gloeophyllum trabeum (strain ATCC 11539 / FP-39264 / Madison 617) TaxID=670483 RepID=S7RVH0_GLOTA|nr:uncharacterized protein GLOTRDRAFT_73909 [Gloeophyllum trabeum ATCC 11539]EPQ57249.1 hypothetical protein GLOTRDRAFT_73909 [Gloeophyllum trabeum ATCC 11539]
MISEPLTSKGIQFYFEDSGVPSAETYTTLVIIHGTSYHSSIFHKLVPLGVERKLRIVLLNRRDYPGSTFTTPEEIAKIQSARDEDQAQILRELGLELAAFLAWYIRQASIPPLGEEGAPGGLTVLGWSSANATGLSAIANLDLAPDEDKELFRTYLRAYISYDAPMYVYGYPVLTDVYHPLRDPSIEDFQERIKRFNVWVSSYYQHPDLTSRSFQGLSQRPPEDPPSDKRPTFYRFTPSELEAVTFPDALTRGEGGLRFMSPAVYKENARKIWYDEGLASMFPRLKVKLIYCKESMVEMVWAAWKMEDDVRGYVEKGGKGRGLEVQAMDGNHFAHWDRPAETMEFFAMLL